jgi:hypothetical protein
MSLFIPMSVLAVWRKLPFWVYMVGVGVLGDVVGSFVSNLNLEMLSELAWVMCVGAGRNFVSISLGLLVVFTPPI